MVPLAALFMTRLNAGAVLAMPTLPDGEMVRAALVMPVA